MQPQSVLSDLHSAQDYAARSAAGRHMLLLGLLVTLAVLILIIGSRVPLDSITGRGTAAIQVSEPVATAAVAGPIDVAPVNPPAAPELRLRLDSLALPVTDMSGVPITSGDPLVAPKLLNFDVAGNGYEASIGLEFSSPPRYTLHVLEGPPRLLVQMPRIEMSPSSMRDLAPIGLVDGLRLGGDRDTSKLIFDLNRPVEIAGARITPASGGVYRFEIRLSAAELPLEALNMDIEEQISLPAEYAEPAPEVVVPASMEVVPRSPPPAGSAEREFQQGAGAYRIGDLAAAIEYFHRAVMAEPKHLKARRFLVAVLIDQGDMQSAARFAEEGLVHYPADPVLLRTLARIHFENGDSEAALAVLTRSRPALKDDPDYYALTAAILQKQSRHIEAADLYTQLLRLDPRRGVWWAGFGISLEALGRTMEARSAFERAQHDATAPADLRRYAGERAAALGRKAG